MDLKESNKEFLDWIRTPEELYKIKIDESSKCGGSCGPTCTSCSCSSCSNCSGCNCSSCGHALLYSKESSKEYKMKRY